MKIDHVKLYVDGAGEWRFTAYAPNNEAIVVSSEGYFNKADAEDAATSLFPEAKLIEKEEQE